MIGEAAAMALDANIAPKDVDVKALQNELLKTGAIFKEEQIDVNY